MNELEPYEAASWAADSSPLGEQETCDPIFNIDLNPTLRIFIGNELNELLLKVYLIRWLALSLTAPISLSVRDADRFV